MLKNIKKKFEKLDLYKTENGYEYFVYPYKGITPIDCKEIKYLAKIISSKISKDVDLIFTIESDGIFTALPISLLTNKPLVVARTFNYKMNNFFKFVQKTGYYKRDMFFYFDPKKIKKVAIIDCVLSTGGTLNAVSTLFDKLNVEIEGIYVVVNKINYSNHKFIDKISNKLFAIFDIEVKGNHLIVEKSKYYK